LGYLVLAALLVYGCLRAVGHAEAFWQLLRLDVPLPTAVPAGLGVATAVLAVAGGRRG
jgi:hypothetical protein